MKPAKLWQSSTSTNSVIDAFTVGDDLVMDQYLIKYDIWGSLAHVQMLYQTELLVKDDYQHIHQTLLALLNEYEHDQFKLQAGDEDVHTRIENDITNKYPQAGANLHIGRSRNDQVLVDIRLFTKDQLHALSSDVIELISALTLKAEANVQTPMPGYTHMQPAMLSSVGLWLAQFSESLLDDLIMVQTALELNDQSPLGSGAGYGVSLPINRKTTSELLGFKNVQNNALYCQNSRGKWEGFTIHTLSQIMQTLSRFATDVLLFTTTEYNFFSLPIELTTGSSIMPQKRNIDCLELLRAKTKAVIAAEFQIINTVSNLPSGYNRDLQEIKKPYFMAFDTVQSSLAIVTAVVQGLEVNSEEINKHLHPEMFAAHWTYRIMEEKQIPFRSAYFEVKKNLKNIPSFDSNTVLNQTLSQGGPGRLNIEEIWSKTKAHRQYWNESQKVFSHAIDSLISSKI